MGKHIIPKYELWTDDGVNSKAGVKLRSVHLISQTFTKGFMRKLFPFY